MTRKRKVQLIVGIALTLCAVAFVFYFYLAKPSSFLSSEEILAELNKYSPDPEATEILETLEIDDRHVYVPFITKDNKYGTSLWIWEKHKWELVAESDNGAPKLLKVDSKDPSSYRVFWNIHPDDHLSYGELYYIRNRNYHRIEGIDNYYPRLQMKTILDFEEKPYGIIELPNEWQKVMETTIRVEEARQPDSFFNDYFPVLHDVYLGWLPYNKEHERQDANKSHNGGGSWSGIDLQPVMYLDEEQLEYINMEE
ncbi:hypothetical protein V7112_15215 [Bacillus sp. JJ1566]|uniref:hypothetical protein n=1 Tax=Bacillus sp. JJ1566 TaxID=3122961 RepID=UPI002FFDCF93